MIYTLVVDTETTGLPVLTSKRNYYSYKNHESYDGSRMLELAYVIYDDEKNIVVERSNLVKTDVRITNDDIHGITNKKIDKEGIDINDIFDLFVDDTANKEIVIVAHNIRFDTNIILSEAHRNKRNDVIDKINGSEQICTCVLGMTTLKLQCHIKLVVLYRKLFQISVVQEHRALSDVKLCADCYFELLKLGNN